MSIPKKMQLRTQENALIIHSGKIKKNCHKRWQFLNTHGALRIGIEIHNFRDISKKKIKHFIVSFIIQ